MLATKRLVCVAPEVDLRECTLHLPPQKANKAEPTLALNPKGDITRNPKQGYQWPQKRACVSAKNFKKNKKNKQKNPTLFEKPFFCRTHSHVLFWGHWYPCFGILVVSPLGFKTKAHCGSKCNIHSLRFTSGATHCQPLEIQHCAILTRFISCLRILLCCTSDPRTRSHRIMSSTRYKFGQGPWSKTTHLLCVDLFSAFNLRALLTNFSFTSRIKDVFMFARRRLGTLYNDAV